MIVHADAAAVDCTLVTGCSAHEVDKEKPPIGGPVHRYIMTVRDTTETKVDDIFLY